MHSPETMAHDRRYRAKRFSRNRRMVAASANAGRRQNNIHMLLEADVTEVRRLMEEYREETGERLSMTAVVTTCLARAVSRHPYVNAFRRGRRLILLEDVTIGVMVERELGGESVPEPLGIQSADTKSYLEIHSEIRATQRRQTEALGEQSGAAWIRFIPVSLFNLLITLASRSITMMSQYGAISVTAVGMFGPACMTPIPLVGGATIAVAVGGIVPRVTMTAGAPEEREHLCLTVTFNHDIVDGAPAARFVKELTMLLESAALLDVDAVRQRR